MACNKGSILYMKKVSIIIINYNTKEILRDCILNLDGKHPNMELIVIDNDSPDNSSQMIKEEFLNEKYPWVKLIEAENNGLAASANIGFKESDGDYLLYLGSDAFPEKGTVEGMVDWMEKHKDVGMTTCKLVQRDFQLDMDAHRGFPTPWVALSHFLYLDRIFPKSKLFNGYFKGWENMEAPHEIDLCISHFMMIRREVLEEIGGWNEDYWLYGEDVDLCWNIKQAGYKIFYLPMWTAVHYKGSSVGVRKSSVDVTKASFKDKYRSHKASAQSMKKFYENNWKDKYPKFLTAVIFFAINIIGKYRLFMLNAAEGKLFDKKGEK